MKHEEDNDLYIEPNDTQLLYYLLMMSGSNRQDLVNAYNKYTSDLGIEIDGEV